MPGRPVLVAIIVSFGVALLAINGCEKETSTPDRESARPEGGRAVFRSLEGRVRVSGGAYLKGALVVVQHWNANSIEPPVLTLTDAAGAYSVLLRPGLYDVFISCSFCSPQATKVEVSAGKLRAVVDVDLQFSPLAKWRK